MFSPESQQRAGGSVSRPLCAHLDAVGLVVVVEVVDQHRESVQVHVVVAVVLLRVGEFVYEGVGFGAPLALLRCRADQVG